MSIKTLFWRNPAKYKCISSFKRIFLANQEIIHLFSTATDVLKQNTFPKNICLLYQLFLYI